MVDEALLSIGAAKAGLKDETLVARLERDENCLRLTRLFLDFWSASGRFRRSGSKEDRQKAAETGRAYLDLIGRVGGLTVGGWKLGYVKSAVTDLTSPGTFFPSSGRFVYEDDCNDGGKSYHALRRSGYEISKYGFSLRPDSEGEIVYDMRAGEGFAFRDARLREMYFHLAEDGHNRVEISRDDGKTWLTAYQDVKWHGRKPEYDLTRHIAGASAFLLRFRHRNGPKAPRFMLMIDNWRIAGEIGPADDRPYPEGNQCGSEKGYCWR